MPPYTSPDLAIRFVWIGWVVSWLAAAAWSERTIERPGARREVPYRLLAIVGAIFLFGLYSGRIRSDLVLWQTPPAVAWLMVFIATLGFAFTWWARIVLGRLWSSTVTRKEGHHI